MLKKSLRCRLRRRLLYYAARCALTRSDSPYRLSGRHQTASTFNVDQLLHGQWLSVDGVRAALLHVFYHESSLEHVTGGGRQHGVLRDLVADWGGKERVQGERWGGAAKRERAQPQREERRTHSSKLAPFSPHVALPRAPREPTQ